MPDIRTLLDDVTARAPHPDPLAAVHGTVRRRARRRRGAAAVAVAATAAAGAVAVRLPGVSGEPVAPATTEGDVRFRSDWRRYAVDNAGAYVEGDEYQRVVALVHANPEDVVGFRQVVEDGVTSYEVAFSADTDPGEWTAAVDAAAAGRHVSYQQCARTAAALDRTAADTLSAPWPSGASVRLDQIVSWQVSYEFPCTVAVVLDRPPTAADRAFAERRWGGDVVVRSGDEAGRP